MRPMSRMGRPPWISAQTLATKLAIAMVVASLLYALADSLRPHLLLIPELVFSRFALWQPLTYTLIATSPMEVIFGGIILWSIGGALESTWGGRRMLTFAVGVTILSGLLTLLLALLVTPLRGVPYSGATVMTSAVWVAYGLSWGSRQTNFWGMPITGNVLALIGVGFVVLSGAFGGFARIVPEAFALMMAFAYVRGFSPRTLLLRLQSWRLRQQLKGRSKHLRVVGKERNMPGDSDRYLH